MFTTCTHCGSRFRLNVAQLTAAHGQVRCGKCGEVFDAHTVLEGADLPPKMPDTTGPEDSELMAAQAPEAEAPDMSLTTGDETPPELEMPLAVEDEPLTSAPTLQAGSRRSPPPIDDLFAGLPDETESRPEEMPALGVESAEAETVTEVADLAADPVPGSFAHVDMLHTPPMPKPRRPLVNAATWTLIGLLLLLLGTQLVDLDRAALSQNPVIGPSLQAVYAALGHPLDKPASVSDWNVSALNVTTDPDSNGALSITGSLVNQASFVQAWPLLRVVLTDRFGTALRSRDFKPADYLPAGQAASLMAPGLAARFRLDIVDPGADAVGFSLTPCMDVPAGRICAAPNATD